MTKPDISGFLIKTHSHSNSFHKSFVEKRHDQSADTVQTPCIYLDMAKHKVP